MDREARDAALVRAFELLEAVQSSTEVIDLEGPLRQASDNGWPDVRFMIHYAEMARDHVAGVDFRSALDRMAQAAEAAGDAAMSVCALAGLSEAGADRGSSGEEPDASDDGGQLPDGVERTLAKAVTMLDQGEGSAELRPTAYLHCGIAYHRLGAWGLAIEMMERAERALEVPLRPSLSRVVELTSAVLVLNRVEAELALACEALELGKRETARLIAAHRRRLTPTQCAAVNRSWSELYLSMTTLLATLAGEPLDAGAHDMLLTGQVDHPWPGSRAYVHFADAIRWLDAGDAEQAARCAEEAVVLTDELVPSLRTVCLAIAAQAPPASPAALRYGRELAEARARARHRLEEAARARLRAELHVQQAQHEARHAYVDALTGLASRLAYERHLQRVRRDDDASVAVLLVDVDLFKQVNDTYGHQTGDQVLRRIGSVLLASVRPDDLAARVGGDEFVLLLHGCSAEQAASRADLILREVDAVPWEEVAPGLRASVSIGAAAGRADLIDALIEHADHQMYAAKGRRTR